MKPKIHFEGWRKHHQVKSSLHDIYIHCENILESEKYKKLAPSNPDYGEILTINNISNFIVSGRQVFSLGEKMVSMFLATSVNNISPEDLRSPYEFFWVSIPPGIVDNNDDKAAIYGMYIHNVGDGFYITAQGEIKTYAFSFYFDHYAKIMLQKKLESHLQLTKEYDPISVRFLRIAFNLMMYLQSVKSEVAADKESLNRAAKVDKLEEDLPLLSSSKQDKIITKIASKQVCRIRHVGPTLEATHKTIGHHWVRGHWHTYLCGARKKKRKILWVMPYEKGIEHEQDPIRVYRVGE